jgi:putative flippase GtrA
LNRDRLRTWEQFFRFGFVGIVGFASCTWLLNRRWTFNDRSRSPARQWAWFLAANSCGGFVNYGVYAFLVLHSNALANYPVLAVAIGSISGLTINFLLSKYLVFEMARLT